MAVQRHHDGPPPPTQMPHLDKENPRILSFLLIFSRLQPEKLQSLWWADTFIIEELGNACWLQCC